jgi:hypothetical protein
MRVGRIRQLRERLRSIEEEDEDISLRLWGN